MDCENTRAGNMRFIYLRSFLFETSSISYPPSFVKASLPADSRCLFFLFCLLFLFFFALLFTLSWPMLIPSNSRVTWNLLLWPTDSQTG